MADPLVLTEKAVQASPQLRDLVLRLRRAMKTGDMAAVQSLEAEIAAYLGKPLDIMDEED